MTDYSNTAACKMARELTEIFAGHAGGMQTLHHELGISASYWLKVVRGEVMTTMNLDNRMSRLLEEVKDGKK